jgi:hypothetical protein
MILLDGREGRPSRDDDLAPPRNAPRQPRGGYQPPSPPDIGDEDIPF